KVAQHGHEVKRPPAATLGIPITLEEIETTPPPGWPSGMSLSCNAYSWDFLGEFKLTNGGPEQLVKLYSHDFCSADNRRHQRTGGVGKSVQIESNTLFLEAVFQDINGHWHQKLLTTMTNTDYLWAEQISKEEITLGFRGFSWSNLLLGESLQ